MLKLNRVSHSYGQRRVLQDLTLTLSPGQRLALMGPSGCGKTTALNLALGLRNPGEGTVENTFSVTAAVFQEPRLLPWLTAADNVNLVLGGKKTTLAQAKARLKEMGLEDAAEKYPRELSGGMQQRVAIARALAAEPDLLVLDEPFRGLDEALRESVIRVIRQTDAAILLVTHDREEAEKLGCTVITL